MGGGNYASMGMGTMGGIVGGIGDIIQAQNYKQPKLLDPVGPEKRLRQIAQDQLMGGGQQLLGATALYNQMAPLLMSQLPGMSFHPGDSGGGGAGTGTAAGDGSSPLGSYADQLGALQSAQADQQRLIDMKAQRKGAKKGERAQYNQQIKDLKRKIKGSPTPAQQERRAYTAGAQPGAYDIRMGGSGGANGPQSGGPTAQSSLGSINDLLASLRPDTTGSSTFDPMAAYRGAGGY